jgi:hypothetical protein
VLWFHRKDYETTSEAHTVFKRIFKTDDAALTFLRNVAQSLYIECQEGRLVLPCPQSAIICHPDDDDGGVYYNPRWLPVDAVRNEWDRVYDCENTDHLLLYESPGKSWPGINLNSVRFPKDHHHHTTASDEKGCKKKELVLPFRLNIQY